jgi:hypothetical protein
MDQVEEKKNNQGTKMLIHVHIVAMQCKLFGEWFK